MENLKNERPLRRPVNRRVVSIKMDPKEVVQLTQNRDQWQALLNTEMNFRIT